MHNLNILFTIYILYICTYHHSFSGYSKDYHIHSLDHGESKGVPEKHVHLFYLLHQSLWLYDLQQTEKFFKIRKYQTTLTASCDICMQVKKWPLELEVEQQIGSKLGNVYIKAVCCHLVYLTYMQITSCEMLGRMKHRQESRLPGEISITSDMQITPLLCQKGKKN